MKRRTELSVLALLLSFSLLLSGCSMMQQSPASILKAQPAAEPAAPEQTTEAESAAAQPAAEETDTPEGSEAAPQETVSEDDMRPEPEEVDANTRSKAGVFADPVYRNDFFGFQIEVDDTWTVDDLAEVNEPQLADQNADAGQTPDEVIDAMKMGGFLYTFSKMRVKDISCVQRIQVGVERIGIKGVALVSMDEYVEIAMEKVVEVQPDWKAVADSIQLGEESFPAIHIEGTVTVEDTTLPVYLEYIVVKKDDYAASIVLTTYYEDTRGELLPCVSLL